MRKAVSLPQVGGILLFSVLAAIMYRGTFGYLLSRWSMEDFTYSYFLPVIAGYLVWERRRELAREQDRPSWAGILPAFMGVVLFWMGELGGEFTAMFVSLWLLLLGALWSMFGVRKLRMLAFPLFLLLAMVPPPAVLYHTLTLKLKLYSSRIGVFMLQTAGYSAYREGNVIDLGFAKLEVVDACSGLRYLFPLIVLGILLAYFQRMAWWKKGVLVLSAVPVSVFTNSLRIALIGVLYRYVGPAAAKGFLHDFSGWFIFMMSLALLLLEISLLKRIFREEEREKLATGTNATGTEAAAPGAGSIRFVARLAVVLLLMAGSAAALPGVAERRLTPMRHPFAGFPLAVGGWSGQRQSLDPVYLDELQLSDYLLADFSNARGETVNCYVAFSDHQTKGQATHSPSSCLPGGGWQLQEPARVSVAGPSGGLLIVNRAVMVMGGERRLTYYWFDQRGRILTDLYQVKLYNFLDSIVRNRTDGALVRLITPIREGEGPHEADMRLKGFVRDFTPLLGRFLPAGSRS